MGPCHCDCRAVSKTGCTNVIIDQFASEHVVINALKQKKLAVTLTQRHRAEADPVVAAASILARAAFLEGLENLSKQFEMEIPKGASPKVVKIGKLLVRKFGPRDPGADRQTPFQNQR